jgi:hypothetical protein
VNAAFGEFFCRKAVFGDYRNAMFANNAFRVFLINVFTARTVLLLGCSLTDPDLLAFLGALTFHTGGHLGGRPLRADAHERHVLHCAAQRRNAVWNSHSGR